MSVFMKIQVKFVITVVGLFIPLLLHSLSISGSEQRTALVIGNSAYESGKLTNPVNDAGDMASALKRLDFDVILKKNTAIERCRKALRILAIA